MTDTEMIKLFKCLADKSRLLILKTLSIEDMYVERLAERLNLTPATISFHLKKLEEIKAVTSHKEQYYTVYSLCRDTFSIKILDLIQLESSQLNEQEMRDEQYRNKVIGNFMVYGKLKTFPAQRKKKNIILEELIKAFEFEKDYTEKEVNIILADYYDDFCTIRRDLVDMGLLAREDGVYHKVKALINK